MGWNLYYGVLLVVFVSALYAILGGLNTVLYTDAVQVVIMVAGGITVTVVGQYLRVIIDREAREIMHLVASIRPSVRLCALSRIGLARDPPSRHFGRVFGYFGRVWADRQPLNILFWTGDSQKLPKHLLLIAKLGSFSIISAYFDDVRAPR